MSVDTSKELRGTLRFQKDKSIDFTLLPQGKTFKKDDIFIKITDEEYENCQLGTIEIKLENSYFKDNHYLEMERPVQLYLPLTEIPEKITAFYLFLEWWTRPSFTDTFKDIPEKTQVALFKFKDHYGCFIPMVGEAFKASLNNGTETELGIEMTALVGGIKELKEPLYIFSESRTVDRAVKKVFKALAKYKGIKLRDERRVPEIFKFLGWCSWDAVYKEVDEKAIRDKARELTEKAVPIRWMIIDDGWMTSQGELLCDFIPDGVKFPNGFKKLTDDIKSESMVDSIGVWHALGGYWSGIDPESDLRIEERPYLFETVNGKVVPSPTTGAAFYKDWYRYLRNQGIDFVKVDGQSSIPSFFENSIPIARAARGLNEALEEGAAYLDNTIINCMGMAMENILARPSSAISRNSNDFYPVDEESFAEHLIENAYNAIYHNEVFNCDWDMFWTTHKHNIKHSLLRAISGGPVYISDKIGETNPEVLEPLSYLDGEVLMMDRSARPTEDCVFIDPLKDGILKLQNIASYGQDQKGGGIALFNLAPVKQSFRLSPGDISDLTESNAYWIYDYFNRKAFILKKDESFEEVLEPEAFSWYVVLPKKKLGTPLGLINKYVGFTSVESIIENENILTFVVKETGDIAWLSDKEPGEVLLNGRDITEEIERDGNLFILKKETQAQKMIITIVYK